MVLGESMSTWKDVLSGYIYNSHERQASPNYSNFFVPVILNVTAPGQHRDSPGTGH